MTPIFSYWFNLTIRRERKSFIFASLVVLSLLVAIFFVIDFLSISSRVKDIIFLIYTIASGISSYTLTAQRLRDINVTGWLALLWFPIAWIKSDLGSALYLVFIIVLCVVPGTDGANKYGNRVRPND